MPDPYAKFASPISVRFTREQYDDLKTYNEVSGVPLNEIIRRAVTLYLTAVKIKKERSAA